LLHAALRTYASAHADDYDTVYIAHCYPYTYTRLQKYLKTLENDPVKKHRFQRKFLCLTESGNKYACSHPAATT
jgi:hypothetical protein